MSDELKPCPFCGGTLGFSGVGHKDGCYIPMAISSFAFTREQYDEAWNRRASLEAATTQASQQGAVAIYQLQMRGKDWSDVDKQTFDNWGLNLRPECSRIVYTHPAASPDSLRRDAMEEALSRMDRARNILTNGNPTPECNWGLLDTADLRALSKQPSPSRIEATAALIANSLLGQATEEDVREVERQINDLLEGR